MISAYTKGRGLSKRKESAEEVLELLEDVVLCGVVSLEVVRVLHALKGFLLVA